MLRVDFNSILAVESELPEIIVKARAGQPLSEVEQFRVQSFYRRMFIAWEWEWGEQELGRFDAPVASWRRIMDGEGDTNYPGARETWEDRKSTFDPGFVKFMEEEIMNQ